MIEVTRTSATYPLHFSVRVVDEAGESRHEVRMSRTTFKSLTKDSHSPEQCVDAAFRFLLDREPRQAILTRFDINLISTYFPDFEQILPSYLDGWT